MLKYIELKTGHADNGLLGLPELGFEVRANHLLQRGR